MAILEIRQMDWICVTLLAFGVDLSNVQKNVIKLWPQMDFQTKRGVQRLYSKYLQTQKYATTQDNLKKTAKKLFDSNI